jgi:hypothetical protein
MPPSEAEHLPVHLWPMRLHKVIDQRLHGHAVGRQHVATLMRTMGIEALHPKRRFSAPHPGHKIYPYLLRGMA